MTKVSVLGSGVMATALTFPDGFEHVLDLVEEASEGLLEDIRERHLRGRIQDRR